MSYPASMRPSAESRFWLKVQQTDNCWLYTGTRNKAGYGRFCARRGHVLAHRYMWELKNGAIPDGLHVCHRCDNPICVNPDHLFLGTQQVNIADMVSKGRQHKGVTHGMNRLTESDIVNIRLLAANGLTQKEIGLQFNIHQGHVSLIVKRKIWSHVV